jgi:hypothetical protein
MRRNFIFLLLFQTISTVALSQKNNEKKTDGKDMPLTVNFENGKNGRDTIFSNSSQAYYTAKIKIAKQDVDTKPKIIFSINAKQSNVKDLMIPTKMEYVAEDKSKDAEVEFKVAFTRDAKNDRTLVFNVVAKDGNDTLSLNKDGDKSTSLEVYIKPYGELENSDNEYWLFVGTNFDLLDGIKANDLYFRGSFLIPLNNQNPKRDQLYITFEKNRFFSEKDSLYRINFIDRIYKPRQGDSITIVNGQYNSFRETITENLGFSLNYLRNTSANPSERYNFYLMGGLYMDHQNKKIKYSNHSILSDTTTFLRNNDSDYIFRPLLVESRTQSWNFNMYAGFMYIHSGTSVNLKAFLQAGTNYLWYPASSIRTSTSETTRYEKLKDVYMRFHLDATLIESPGVSFGAEVYYRRKQMPLFNFTLTKVFDYRQIKNFFGKVPAQ